MNERTGWLLWLSNDAAGWASVLDWSWSASRLLSSSKLASQETSIVVRLVKWVDEWVQSFASSAIWDKGTIENSGNFWGEFSSILVEGKVTVGGVMRVDEGVSIWVSSFFYNIVVEELWFWGWESLWLGSWSWSWSRCWSSSWGRLRLSNWLLARLSWFWGWSSYESSGILSSRWNVSTFEDSETFLTS